MVVLRYSVLQISYFDCADNNIDKTNLILPINRGDKNDGGPYANEITNKCPHSI